MKVGNIECVRCHESKKADLFPNNKAKTNGKSSWCRVCTHTQQREARGNLKRDRQERKPKRYVDYLNNDIRAWLKNKQTLRTQ